MARKMNTDIAQQFNSPFELIRHTNADRNEYWSSRELATVLAYSSYRNFEQVIAKARTSCVNSGQQVGDHFVDVTDMVEVGKGAKRELATIFLSRFACYLIVQNADPRKEMVALGQTYFAIQARQQELATPTSLKSLIKSVHQIYDELRTVAGLQTVNKFNVVFVLLFYKRISDTSLLSIPEGHRWIDVRSNKDPKKLTMILDNMRRILGMHNDSDKDLFSALVALDVFGLYSEVKPAIQHSIFKHLDSIDLSFDSFGLFAFDSALSAILDDYAKVMLSHRGEYTNPAWIEELLVKMLEPKSHETVYFPFCKTASIISTFIKASQSIDDSGDILENPTLPLNIQGIEHNTSFWAFAKLRLTLLGGLSLDISNGNPYETPPKLPPDVVYCIPPFGYKSERVSTDCVIGKEKVEVPKSRGEVLFLLNTLQQTSKTGRIGAVVPIGILFDHSLRKVRRALLDEDLLEAIIELPDKSFFPTTSVKAVLLILNKAKSSVRKNKVTFGILPSLNKRNELASVAIDSIVTEYHSNTLSDKWILASKEDIQRQDYNLVPSYYHDGLINELDVLLQDKNGKRLDEICTIIRGRSRRPIENSTGLPFVSTKDLSGEVTDPYLDFSYVTLGQPEAPNHIITQHCILVSLVGRAPKATIYDPKRAYKSEGDELYGGILINPNIVCLIPNEQVVDFEYLYYQLNTPLFLKQFDSLHGSVGIPNISLPELRTIMIPVFERKEQQKEITRQTKEALLIEANAKLETLRAILNIEEQKQEAEFQVVRHLAHNLSPRLSSVSSVLKHLYEFLASKDLLNEPIQEQFYEGQEIELVHNAITKARHDVVQMNSLIKDTRKVITEEIRREDFSMVNIVRFLNNIKTKYLSRKFTLEIECEDSINFELHETSFAEMIDNFIRNAEIHGFAQQNQSQLIVISCYIENKCLNIDVKNNGLPLPAELTVERFTSFGEKRTNSPGEGLGGAYIDKVIRAHEGSLQIITSDKKFPTLFRICLPLRSANNE